MGEVVQQATRTGMLGVFPGWFLTFSVCPRHPNPEKTCLIREKKLRPSGKSHIWQKSIRLCMYVFLLCSYNPCMWRRQEKVRIAGNGGRSHWESALASHLAIIIKVKSSGHWCWQPCSSESRWRHSIRSLHGGQVRPHHNSLTHRSSFY